jgi:hypothetical protein
VNENHFKTVANFFVRLTGIHFDEEIFPHARWSLVTSNTFYANFMIVPKKNNSGARKEKETSEGEEAEIEGY